MTWSGDSWARTATLVCGTFCLFQLLPFEPRLLGPSVGLAVGVACLIMVLGRWQGRHDAHLALWLLVVGVAAGVVLLSALSVFIRAELPVAGLLPAVMALSAAVAIGAQGRKACVGFGVLLATFAVVALGDMALLDVRIDVKPFLQGGLEATLSGSSPYGVTIANPYTPEETLQYYGPGVVSGDRVLIGYPYLPVPLLLDIPAHLLGDARLMHLAALIGAAVIGWRLSTDSTGRAAAVFLVINPLSTIVLAAYWVEPVLVLLLALTVWAMVRSHGWTGIVLGLFFASKQYAVCFVPALWSVARSSGWRTVVTATVVGSVIVGAFALWDPRAFYRSAIEFQVVQPFRDDSMSLLPGLADTFGPLPAWALALSPVLGLLVSLLVALRTRPGATAFLLGIGLSLFFMVLLSKQAFMNYYFLIGAAFLLAVIVWPRDDPLRELES